MRAVHHGDGSVSFGMKLRELHRCINAEVHGTVSVRMPDGSWRWKSWAASHRG